MYTKLEQYRIFCAVAAKKSFSKAAEELYLTQSAVSQSVRTLESMLETDLFVRRTKGVELTAEGQILYEYAANALSLIDTAKKQIEKRKALETGELRIGASDTISKYFLIPVLEKFNNMYPKIKFKIINRVSTESIELLKFGKIDMAFINLPYKDETIVTEEILTVNDIFVAGAQHSEIYEKKKIPLLEIAKQPLILLEKKANSRLCVDAFFMSCGIRLIPEIELGSHDLLLDFAAANLGVSCVIKEFSKEYLDDGRLFELDTEIKLPPRKIGVCTLKGVTVNKAAREFLTLLKNK